MINLVKEVGRIQSLNHSTGATQTSCQSKTQTTPVDIVVISATAKAAMHEAMETPAETDQEARSCQSHARRRMEKQAVQKEFLGID